MQLSEKQINDLIEAWKADFGETLSPDAARSEALRLLDFFVWMVDELTAQKRQTGASPADDTTKP